MANLSGKMFSNKLQDVLSKTNEFLDYSMDHVIGIRGDVNNGLTVISSELKDVIDEIAEVLTASDSVTEAYKQIRSALASADAHCDYEEQEKLYQEAERFLRLRSNFEERERYLRRRRDDLEREKLRMEKIMIQSSDVMNKLSLAIEILRSKMESLGLSFSTGSSQSVSLALQFAERENKRLAREIHDCPIQQFAASVLSFEYLEKLVAKNDREAVNIEIARIKDQLQEALADFRGFLSHLQPKGVEKSLAHAIKRLAEESAERHRVDFNIEIDENDDSLPLIIRSNILRIVQEAVSNALRHGRAKKINVKCFYKEEGNKRLHIIVEDDGCGFDVEKESESAVERRSMGLVNMRERVHFMGGKIKIQSEHGKGTKIHLNIPLGGGS